MAQDAKDYVAQLYEKELGRASTGDAGADYWANQIASGAMSQADVRAAIAGSAEAQVKQAYQQELGRSAIGDPGATGWINAVASGQMTADEARANIARSAEGAKYDVNRLYREELNRGREKDTASNYWEQELMAGRLDEAGLLKAIRESDEYKRLQQAPVPAPVPVPPPTPAPALPTREERYEQLRADAMARYETQLKELQNQALKNATAGNFTPTAPLTQAAPVGDVSGTAAPVTAATEGLATAAPPQAPTPAPAVFVPQTYLAPPPPQYRGISPFEGPYQSPFPSYYSIAMGNRMFPQQMYSYMPQGFGPFSPPMESSPGQGQLPTAAMTTPVQTPST